jgi:hypothetical protein
MRRLPRCCHGLTTMQSQFGAPTDHFIAVCLLLADKQCGEIAINLLTMIVER